MNIKNEFFFNSQTALLTIYIYQYNFSINNQVFCLSMLPAHSDLLSDISTDLLFTTKIESLDNSVCCAAGLWPKKTTV